MYKVYFNESFFLWLDYFVESMKNYYQNFYFDTWIQDIDKIIQLYFEEYDKMKTDILTNINYLCINWLLWRKIISVDKNIEICSYNFKYWSYNIIFSSIKNNTKNEIIVTNLKIEI